tara:strand:- start:1025 stop:1216 length:192 start_codon:yes stop_codon:yes gene_type:complete
MTEEIECQWCRPLRKFKGFRRATRRFWYGGIKKGNPLLLCGYCTRGMKEDFDFEGVDYVEELF